MIEQLTDIQYDILIEMEYDWCYPFSNFNGTKKELSKEFKILREAGLVSFERGLMTDEGQVAGSGYCLNWKAKNEIEKLINDYEAKKVILERKQNE